VAPIRAKIREQGAIRCQDTYPIRFPHPIFQEPIFNETVVSGDPQDFSNLIPQTTMSTSKDVVAFEKSRLAPGEIFKGWRPLLDPRGADIVGQIAKAGEIVFHALGDSGASNSRNYGNEINVADQLTTDAHSADPSDRPAFLFHLGDVVYDFGESKFYYDQFYDPFRNYPAPIFAIPGNHDPFIVPGTPAGSEPLTIFCRNFCSESPAIAPEAASLHRTAMIQLLHARRTFRARDCLVQQLSRGSGRDFERTGQVGDGTGLSA
jgi:Calcineurin-like phosphoesterase